MLYYRTTKALLRHSMSRLSLLLCVWLMGMAVSAKDFTVVIDAGHGGLDPGSIGYKTKVRESDVNLTISKKLENI